MEEQISERAFVTKAVVWDMDGVIADTIPLHFEVWHDMLQEMGMKFTQDDFKRVSGMRSEEVIQHILGGDVAQIQSIARNKEERFRQRVKRRINLFPGVKNLLELFVTKGFRQVLASSAPKENVVLLINELKIGSYFDSIVSGEDVTWGKPNPEVFLIAARRLGVAPKNCIVIEDAIAGIRAAKAAGMRCIAVANTFPREELQQADLVVNSLEEVDEETLKVLSTST
jgi:beta-phosphoglucomutase family hydrolase